MAFNNSVLANTLPGPRIFGKIPWTRDGGPPFEDVAFVGKRLLGSWENHPQTDTDYYEVRFS